MPNIHETKQALANWAAFAKENPLETMVLLSTLFLAACNEAASTGFPTPEATATDAARASYSGTRIAPIDLSETALQLDSDPLISLASAAGAVVVVAAIGGLVIRNRRNQEE